MSEQEKWAKTFVDELYEEMKRREDGTAASVYLARARTNTQVPEVLAHPEALTPAGQVHIGIRDILGVPDGHSTLDTCRELMARLKTQEETIGKYQDEVKGWKDRVGDRHLVIANSAQWDEVLRAVCPNTDDKYLAQMNQDDLIDAIKSLHQNLQNTRDKLVLAQNSRNVGREGFFVPLTKLLGLPDTASYGDILDAVNRATSQARQVDQANERTTYMYQSKHAFLATLAGVLGLETSCEPEILHAVTKAALNQAVQLDPITQSRPLQLGDRVQLHQGVVRNQGCDWVALDIDVSGGSHVNVLPRDIVGRVLPGGKR